jgi:hypothetical protein
MINKEKFLKYGNVSISSGSGVQQLVATKAGNIVYLASAEIMQIVSTDANDTIAGTGARKLTIIGRNGDYEEIEEEIELNGLTIVETNNIFLRVYRAFVTEVGQEGFGKANIGDLTITAKVTASVVVKIGALEGQTLTTQYTTGANTRAEIKSVFMDTSFGRSVIVRLFVRNFGTNSPSLVKSVFQAYQNNVPIVYEDPIKVPPKSDVWFTVESTQPGGADVSLKYFMELIKE